MQIKITPKAKKRIQDKMAGKITVNCVAEGG